MTLLQMSISATILIVVITILRALLVYQLPKKTFLFLWGLVLFRLLIPVSIPSSLSIYSLLPQTGMPFVIERAEPANPLPRLTVPVEIAGESGVKEFVPQGQEAPQESVSGWTVLWSIGFLACLSYFAIAYYRGIKKFKNSQPLETPFIKEWRETHPLKRQLFIQSSAAVSTPLSYGILRPVILLPKSMDFEEETALHYILTHEYVHIKHFDIVTKMLMLFALSIHWFNPMVWVMFYLLNRDIELVCDESVIKLFGVNSRSSYAYTLVDMEAHKAGLIPLYNNFSKNAIHERIGAIMKMKKMTIFSLVLAGLLVAGVAVAFATSAASDKENNPEVLSALSAEESERISALQFAGYEKMSVAEFQEKVWTITDTEEYPKLLERISHDDAFYKQKDSDAKASFFFNILEPLTAEKWREKEFGRFGGYAQIGRKEASDATLLEYSFAIIIKNPYTLTVGEYDTTRLRIKKEMDTLLQDKSLQELQDETAMNTHLRFAIERIEKRYSNDKLKIELRYAFQPLSGLKEDSIVETSYEEQEERQYPHATKEDYRSLLKLKTPNYQEMSVAEFNQKLLEWANEDYERSERIAIDSVRQGLVPLSKEEKDFIGLTVWASGMENAELVRSRYLSKQAEDPVLHVELPSKEDTSVKDASAWCDCSYQLSYHREDTIRIGERDRLLNKVLSEIQGYWDNTEVEQLKKMDKKELEKVLREIAAKNSNEEMIFSIVKGQVYLEHIEAITDFSYSENQGQIENTLQTGEAHTQGNTFSYEEGNALSPDELEKLYSEYKPFGVIYDKKEDCFYYKGKVVGTFIDIMQTNGESLSGGNFKGKMRQLEHPKGEIVISTIRDYNKKDELGNGTLLGVKEGY